MVAMVTAGVAVEAQEVNQVTSFYKSLADGDRKFRNLLPGGHGGQDGGDGEHSPFSGDGGLGSGVGFHLSHWMMFLLGQSITTCFYLGGHPEVPLERVRS